VKIEDQLIFLRRLLAEPVNPDDARWQPLELLDALNEGRRWFAENSKSLQITQSQTTNPGGVPTKFYSVQNEIGAFYTMEWDGIPLTPVHSRDWRNRIGINEDLTGDPYVYKFFIRQIQLFFVPATQKTLFFEGWAYPIELNGITGFDSEFTDQQARGGIYRAAWTLKDSDERDSAKEERHAREITDQFFQQYRPKGPRYVRSDQQINPVFGFLGLRG